MIQQMKAQVLDNCPERRLTWYCPGCKCNHGVFVLPDHRGWNWNASLEFPTLRPSVLIKYNGPDADSTVGLPTVCHCFVNCGNIEFLSDCTHTLAGSTVKMKDLDE